MCEGAAEPIEFPDDQRIACAQGLKLLGEDRPLGTGAADNLGIDFGAASLRQCVDLQIDHLLLGTNACVPYVHGHLPERVAVQLTRLGGITRTLFFRTSRLYRGHASLEGKEVVPCAYDKTIVFSHALENRGRRVPPLHQQDSVERGQRRASTILAACGQQTSVFTDNGVPDHLAWSGHVDSQSQEREGDSQLGIGVIQHMRHAGVLTVRRAVHGLRLGSEVWLPDLVDS